MKSPSFRLLAVTPLFLTAMASSALAQEAVLSSTVTNVTPASLSSVESDAVVYPMKVTIDAAGTFVITSPSDNPVQITLDGDVIMTLPDTLEEGGEAFRVITSLAAGEHLLEVEGPDVTLENVILVSMYELGGEPMSIASVAEPLSAEDAEILAAAVSNLAPSNSNTTDMGAQMASLDLAQRQPFMIGGGSADRASGTSGANGANADGTMQGGVGDGTQMASANPQVMGSTSGSSGSSGTTSSGSTDTGGTTAVSSPGTTGSSGGSISVPRTVTPPAGTPVVPVTGTPVVPPTPTPVIPPVLPADMARASALTPPTNIQPTAAVQILSGATETNVVSASGQTLFGQVMDPQTFDTVTATIAPSGRSTAVDVGATTGQFAVRLFPEDLTSGAANVTIVASSSVSPDVTSVPIAYDFTAGAQLDGITQALSRMTNGPTADLYARVREIGFANYVAEQLNPDAIPDAAFNAMNVDRLLYTDDNNEGRIRTQLFRHNIAHSAFSEKQLQDVMGDFWSNHFFASTKNSEIRQQNVEDREFFRQNAFGNFGDLLLYSARSPLMSQFLDNDQNRVTTNNNGTFNENINENYGREILELHTVGVNGGYTEEDVIQSARIFTGWNHNQTNEGVDNAPRLYEFEFRGNQHDPRDKVFSAQFLNGFTIAGRAGALGVQEGEEFIALLANDPRTQAFVCGKIVQRFVSDDAPANFVQICADTWAATGGNSGEILRALFSAPEYITTMEMQRNKAKTPYEYAVSVIRALNLRPSSNSEDDLNNFLNRFREASRDAGYDPLEFGLPTGLPEVAGQWTSSASMIAKFRQITDAVERRDRSNLDLETKITEAGLETAEEVAGYLLTIATADRFDLAEYEAMVATLKGEDGIFEPLNPDQDESEAFERAAGLLVVLPSFQLQ